MKQEKGQLLDQLSGALLQCRFRCTVWQGLRLRDLHENLGADRWVSILNLAIVDRAPISQPALWNLRDVILELTLSREPPRQTAEVGRTS